MINLRGINDIPIPTLGKTKLHFNIDGTDIEHEFHLVRDNFPISADGIIGIDLLEKYNFSIHFLNGKCKLIKNVEVFKADKITKGHYPKQKFFIPARSEILLPVTILNDLNVGIISKKELLPDVFTSDSLIYKENPIVSVLNLRETPVEIEIPEMELEEFSELDVVDILKVDQTSERLSSLESRLRIEHLNKPEKDSILNICKTFHDLFYFEGDKLGTTDATSHKIPVVDDKPIYVKPFRLPECHRDEVNRQVSEMEKQGIIRKSNSPWNAPLLVVPKKLDASGVRKWRVVIDFRKLNNITVGDAFPIPNITDILDRIGNSKYFTTLDLASGFHQVPIDPDDSAKTAFSNTLGHYEFTRMPFGLKGAPATFQRLMNSVLSGFIGIRCFVYLDDVVIFGHSLEDHNQKLIDVFKRFRKFNLKLHPDKCEFLRREVQYLGHIITENGIKPDPSKISAVENFPIPLNVKNVKSFLGLAGYYRKFIMNFSEVVAPITKLLKKNVDFNWTEVQQKSFTKLKNLLTTAPILQYPDFTQKFILTTDASGVALGAILSQGEPGSDLPIAYASRTLNKPECNYSTIEKELLAIVWGIQHFRPYLYGRHFTILTDHKPLKWLHNHKDLSSRLLRWRLKLEEYSYKIEYKMGKNNTNADALSRMHMDYYDQNNEVEVNKNPNNIVEDSNNNDKINIFKIKESVSKDTIPIKIVNPYENFIERTNKNIIINPNILETENKKCKVKVKVILEDQSESSIELREDSPELFILPINSRSDFENLFKGLELLKDTLINKGINEIQFFNDRKIKYHTIRLMLRYVFQKTDIKIYLNKNKIEPTEEEITKILYEYHDTPTGGHNGVGRTIRKIKEKYIWKNMSKDIRNYIKNCKSCQLNKLTRKKTKAPMEITTTSNRAFEKIFMDIVGPLPLTEYGNKYALTIQDDLSKFSLAIPIKTTDSESIAKSFMESFITKFGMPQVLLTDQGSNFTSELFKNLCKLLKIKKIQTSAYHPQSNGALERSHQTLKDYLKHFINKSQSDWDQWIHLATFSYNTTPHTSSGFSPYELVFGYKAIIPSSFKEDPKFSYSFDDYVQDLKTKLQSSWKFAKEKLIGSKEKSKVYYDSKIITPEFKIGDLVLMSDEATKKGVNKKLSPNWLGPYEVLEIDRVNITIRVKNRSVKIHMNKLKPFYQ